MRFLSNFRTYFSFLIRIRSIPLSPCLSYFSGNRPLGMVVPSRIGIIPLRLITPNFDKREHLSNLKRHIHCRPVEFRYRVVENTDAFMIRRNLFDNAVCFDRLNIDASKHAFRAYPSALKIPLPNDRAPSFLLRKHLSSSPKLPNMQNV